MAVATCIEAPRIIVRRTVADGATIPKGTILELTDSNTGVANSADNDPFGGITIEEKTASDGVVDVGVALDGVFDIDTTAAAVTAGQMVNLTAANAVAAAADADFEKGSIVGKAETTRTGTNRIRVRLMGY